MVSLGRWLPRGVSHVVMLPNRMWMHPENATVITLAAATCSHFHLRTFSKKVRRKPIAIIEDLEAEPATMASHDTPPYEKLGEKNKEFVKMLSLVKSRKQREKKGLMLLEGRRLISDAIAAGAKMTKLFFSKEENLADIPLKDVPDVKIMKVFYKDLQLWSTLTTCPGVMGIFQIPNSSELNLPTDNLLPVTVVCDNVRDPGNMGSIIRCAAAAGCRKLLLTKGCVDVWEPKVLRAASGGHFRIHIQNNISPCYLSDHLTETSQYFVADNKSFVAEVGSGDDTYCYTDVSYVNSETVLVVGGETEGLSEEVMDLCHNKSGKKLHIPMTSGVESLNAAFAMAIIVFEMKRQYTEFQQLSTADKFIGG